MLVGLVSTSGRSPLEVRALADWTRAAPAALDSWRCAGHRHRRRRGQYQVLVQPDRLLQSGSR